MSQKNEQENTMPSVVASKTYGTVAAERRKEMSGLDFVRGLVDGTLPLNTIARTLDYDSPRRRADAWSLRPIRATRSSTLAAPCTAGSRRRCSIATWGLRSGRPWRRASVRRRWSSRSRWCADHAGDWADQSRRRRAQSRPPCRHRRRPHYGSQRPPARPRHDDVFDI
jgi:hypothetical protein